MTELDTTRFKVCAGCGCTKPATPEFFHKSGKGDGKFYLYCKPCRKLYRGFKPRAVWYSLPREWWEQRYLVELLTLDEIGKLLGCGNHTVSIRLRHHGIEVRPQTMKQWREPEPTEKTCLECGKIKVAADFYGRINTCKPCKVAQAARYQKLNPEKHRASVQKRLTAMRGSWGNVSGDVIRQMYDDQQGLCAYCESPLFGRYHIDHIVPLCNGGLHTWDNLAITCPECNQSKNSRSVEEFVSCLR